jgi:hypothetical protein
MGSDAATTSHGLILNLGEFHGGVQASSSSLRD